MLKVVKKEETLQEQQKSISWYSTHLSNSVQTLQQEATELESEVLSSSTLDEMQVKNGIK